MNDAGHRTGVGRVRRRSEPIRARHASSPADRTDEVSRAGAPSSERAGAVFKCGRLIDAETVPIHNDAMTEDEKEPIVSKIADRLAARFPATPRQRIEGVVREEYESLDTGRIRIYIPTLIENSSRTRLRREQKK